MCLSLELQARLGKYILHAHSVLGPVVSINVIVDFCNMDTAVGKWIETAAFCVDCTPTIGG